MASNKTIILSAEKRQGVGTGSARALRREGKVPAIIYGGKGEEVSIALNAKELTLEFMKGHFSSKVVDLQIGKESIHVLPRDVQLHPVTDVVLHADFLRVTDDTKITAQVPVHFLNQETCPGIKKGGVLNIVRRDVELACSARNIPEYLEVDLAELEIGDSIHISHITLPKGSVPTITDRDFTIATLAGRTEEVEEEVAEVAVEAEAEAEGEAQATEESA
jgi:large subunit ribosomal protein L25